MQTKETLAWREYEAGKDYKSRRGLYETVRQNERFYRGDQWSGTSDELPHPVFNLVRRITDYLVSAAAPEALSISYTDDKLPFADNRAVKERILDGLAILNRNAAYRWKRNAMDALIGQALLNAAISGDGVFYCWWDGTHFDGQPFLGEIRTDVIDNTDLFVADVNKTDLQTQEYVMLAGRESVNALRKEALGCGCSEEQIASILPDEPDERRTSDLLFDHTESQKNTTYLIRFFRENGSVMFEKSTRYCVIKRVDTGLKYYPVAYFNWYPAKGSFHGNAPVSDMIANQKYVNTAYAMVMKHMYDTAFSKVVYDKTRIPEWSNEVGQAIAAVGGGNVGDAVSVIGTGKLQQGYLELIENVIETTKDLMGATESALGDEQALNTSAILLLQQASRMALKQVNTRLCRCLGEVATIWADLLCTNCKASRLLVTSDGEKLLAECPDYTLLKQELLRANATAVQADTYTPAATVSLLDKLLAGGHITTEQYVKLLPQGILRDPAAFLATIQEKGDVNDE